MNKVKDLDLYKLLEVSFDSEEAAIRKAYRKKALKCHPDKNPDDPKAAELFHQVYYKSMKRFVMRCSNVKFSYRLKTKVQI